MIDTDAEASKDDRSGPVTSPKASVDFNETVRSGQSGTYLLNDAWLVSSNGAQVAEVWVNFSGMLWVCRQWKGAGKYHA